ncbi:hypothetical protein HpBGD38_14930 [Helicobacter pylori]
MIKKCLFPAAGSQRQEKGIFVLLYTFDSADKRRGVNTGGRRDITQQNKTIKNQKNNTAPTEITASKLRT